MGFAIAISLVMLFVLMGAVQWLLNATTGVWQYAIIGALQLLTAVCIWIASAHIQNIRQQYGSVKTAKTIPGLHRLGFTLLLQRPFHPHALQRLQQLRQLYQDYAVPYNATRLDQLERWLKQGDLPATD